MDALFTSDPSGAHHHERGWNRRAIYAFALAAVFSVSTVWVPALAGLSGYGWVIGAALGGALHLAFMRGAPTARSQAARGARGRDPRTAPRERPFRASGRPARRGLPRPTGGARAPRGGARAAADPVERHRAPRHAGFGNGLGRQTRRPRRRNECARGAGRAISGGAGAPRPRVGGARVPATGRRLRLQAHDDGPPLPDRSFSDRSPASASGAPLTGRSFEAGGRFHGQGDPFDDPRARRGALRALPRDRLRAWGRRPLRLRRLHAGLPAGRRGRLRAGADGQPGPHGALRSGRRPRAPGLRGGRPRCRARALRAGGALPQRSGGVRARRHAARALLRGGSRRLQIEVLQ